MDLDIEMGEHAEAHMDSFEPTTQPQDDIIVSLLPIDLVIKPKADAHSNRTR